MMAKIADSGLWWLIVAAVAVAGLLLIRWPRRLRRGGRSGRPAATTDRAGRRQVRSQAERDAGFAPVVERPGRPAHRPAPPPPSSGCQGGADFTQVMAHLNANLREHARRDRLSPVMTAVFLSRGGHAPGEVCPSVCQRPPAGWECSLIEGHDGPCPTRPVPHDHDPIECWCELDAEDAPQSPYVPPPFPSNRLGSWPEDGGR